MMKWTFEWDVVLKRIFRYLVKIYLGQYLEGFSQDKLSYGLTHGSVEKVELNIESLNVLSEEYKLPVEFLHGTIDFLSFNVPLLRPTQSTVIEVRGLQLIVQPKERQDESLFSSMLDSMMTSSLQLAEECINSKTEDDEEFDGMGGLTEGTVSKVAGLIDQVFANLKVKFLDSSLRIEHVPGAGSSGVSFEVKIASADYFDEAGNNTPLSDNKMDNDKSSYEPQDYSVKRVVFEGVSIYTSEFPAQSRKCSTKEASVDLMEPSQFIPGSPEMPPTHSSFPVKKTEPEFQEVPILISRFLGKQEIRLKLKQKQTISGPKIDVEFNFGAFNLFLIPQQVHMLFELFSELLKPGSNSDTNKKLPLTVANKPLRAADYALVEEELLRQQQKSDVSSKSLKHQQGWSSHSLDESDEEFQLMAMHSKLCSDAPNTTFNDADSLCSSISSDTRSDCTGSSASNMRPSRGRGSTVQAMLQDHMSELTHFQGSFSSLCVIILHDDSVHESLNGSSLSSSKSTSKKSHSLKERAEIFFNDLNALQKNKLDLKNFASAREPLSELCASSHLRLMASSISIDGSERSSSAQCIIDLSLSISQFEVLECLFNSANFADKVQEPTYVPILVCDQQLVTDSSDAPVFEACFKLKYLQTEYTTQSHHIKPPANRLEIQFGPLTCEIDISLTDRIQTLLNFQNSCQMDARNDWKDLDAVRSSSKTEVTVSSPNLTINLRFPIPDLRSVHDMDRVPWWQQNLHPEILILEIKGITLMTTFEGDVSQSKYEIQCRDCHGLFKQSEMEKPISFLRVSVDPDVDEISQNNGFGLPRLVIHQTTKVPGADLEAGLEQHDELFSYSLTDVIMSNMDTKPSPFCSTSVIYGSKLRNKNNSPGNEEKKETLADHEEVIKPADKETILQFMEQTISKTEYLYDFSLPTVNIVFPSKDFFELLYNRLGNDLLLWEKTTLAPKAPYDPNGFKVHVPGLDFNPVTAKEFGCENYPIFRPFANDSNSDSEDDVNFRSFSEMNLNLKSRHQKSDNSNAFTKIAITIGIAKGSLAIHVPVMDNSNEVIPDLCGKLLLRVEEGQLFIASSYKGDENTSYLCILADKSTLYHNASLKSIKVPAVVESLDRNPPKDMQCIIYKSDPGMRLKTSICDNFQNGDMLKIAVHIVQMPKQQLKTFKVAIDISDATLRHYMHSSSQIWINQMISFLKVSDLPVNGYVPSAVVTEFHLNLTNCAIDYRPLKLPLRSVITVENFNFSCNISATTPSFLFRLISDEMRLFITNDVMAKKPDLAKSYICVIDSGLIDVSFRTSVDEKNEARFELCATNNLISIRTCADSLKALMDLLIYVSASGDMETSQPENNVEKSECKSSIVKETDAENLHLLMAEAMKDVPNEQFSERSNNNNSDAPTIINTDDEFCILEDDPGVGLMPRNGEPQVRILTDGPIEIIENHFSVPPGKSDVLKAPKHYPKPLVMLTLREMSLAWNLYGGNDFKQLGKKKGSRNKKKNGVSFSDTKSVEINDNNSVVSFCKVTHVTNGSNSSVKYATEHVTIDQKKERTLDSWLQLGGPNRNQDVLMKLVMKKVKFQRDVYPQDTEYASRYILFIHDIEIKDRLKSSNINKFLYQYSCQKIPRQSNANMIEVKAVYTRPDPNRLSEECSLHVSCKPLRLNIDQDSLLFLIGFFREVIGLQAEENSEENDKEKVDVPNQVKDMPLTQHNTNSNAETFYRVFSFSPDVLIRIDYQGKHVLMEQGALRGLLFGLGQLNSSEIKLKRLCYRHGLLGHHKIVAYATNEWQQDILKNQLPSILGGVGPMHSFVQLFQGVKDFIYMPVAQYKRDGQIVRGFQRGTSALSTSTVMAVLDLASGLVSTIQGVAIFGYDMVSPGPSKFQKAKETFRQISQPADVREGLTTAANVVKVGMADVSRDMYIAASAEHEHKGVPGAIGGVLRQIPKALIKPVIVGTEATNYVIDGVRHQLMPDAHQEDMHKWRTKNC